MSKEPTSTSCALDFRWFRVHWLEGYGWVVARAPAVVVVPFAPDRAVWLVRIRRQPTGQVGWELPGGEVARGESPTEAGIRELAEECGLVPRGQVSLLPPTFEAMPGMGSCPHRVVVAYGVEPRARAPRPQRSEGIVAVSRFSRDDLKGLIRAGELTVHATIVALNAAECFELDGQTSDEPRSRIGRPGPGKSVGGRSPRENLATSDCSGPQQGARGSRHRANGQAPLNLRPPPGTMTQPEPGHARKRRTIETTHARGAKKSGSR